MLIVCRHSYFAPGPSCLLRYLAQPSGVAVGELADQATTLAYEELSTFSDLRGTAELLALAWRAGQVPDQKPALGIDLVDVGRLALMLSMSGSGFLEGGWTRREIVASKGQPHLLAGMWACKEAAMKALGGGLDRFDPRDIEVELRVGGPPRLTLTGTALEESRRLGVGHLAAAIEFERRFTAVIAVVLGQP